MIRRIISSSIKVKRQILEDDHLIKGIETIVDEIVHCYQKGGKVLFCGNGGSAADAQHLAAELSGRFYLDRVSLAAEALHVNTSYLTAVANDYSYDDIYARYTRGTAKKGDIMIGISTSGNSENIVRALLVANEMGMVTVALTGASEGRMKNIAKFHLAVPSIETPRIQESHILIGHIICELVEERLFGRENRLDETPE